MHNYIKNTTLTNNHLGVCSLDLKHLQWCLLTYIDYKHSLTSLEFALHHKWLDTQWYATHIQQQWRNFSKFFPFEGGSPFSLQF